MYSRQSPSPRFAELTRLYAEMHRDGDERNGIPAADMFSGISLLPVAPKIKRLVEATGARGVLDYGCGKASQYAAPYVDPNQLTYPSIVAYWGVDQVACYDPAYGPFSALPMGKFDGVICTDVLEHCPEEDMPWIVDELFAYANMFVFANVACYPAHKLLPNGENAHCTIRPPEWWEQLFNETAARHHGVDWEVWVANLLNDGSGKGMIWRIGSDV
jgi:hypothetical protein